MKEIKTWEKEKSQFAVKDEGEGRKAKQETIYNGKVKEIRRMNRKQKKTTNSPWDKEKGRNRRQEKTQ